MLIRLNKDIYSIESVLSSCYSFLEKSYIYLDLSKDQKSILVKFHPKNRFSSAQLRKLKGDFMNELIFSALRQVISVKNKKIREYIVCKALYSQFQEAGNSNHPLEATKSYKDDPLGIAKNWRKRFGSKSKNNKIS